MSYHENDTVGCTEVMTSYFAISTAGTHISALPMSLCGAAGSCPGLQRVQHDIPGLNGSS